MSSSNISEGSDVKAEKAEKTEEILKSAEASHSTEGKEDKFPGVWIKKKKKRDLSRSGSVSSMDSWISSDSPPITPRSEGSATEQRQPSDDLSGLRLDASGLISSPTAASKEVVPPSSFSSLISRGANCEQPPVVKKEPRRSLQSSPEVLFTAADPVLPPAGTPDSRSTAPAFSTFSALLPPLGITGGTPTTTSRAADQIPLPAQTSSIFSTSMGGISSTSQLTSQVQPPGGSFAYDSSSGIIPWQREPSSGDSGAVAGSESLEMSSSAQANNDTSSEAGNSDAANSKDESAHIYESSSAKDRNTYPKGGNNKQKKNRRSNKGLQPNPNLSEHVQQFFSQHLDYNALRQTSPEPQPVLEHLINQISSPSAAQLKQLLQTQVQQQQTQQYMAGAFGYPPMAAYQPGMLPPGYLPADMLEQFQSLGMGQPGMGFVPQPENVFRSPGLPAQMPQQTLQQTQHQTQQSFPASPQRSKPEPATASDLEKETLVSVPSSNDPDAGDKKSQVDGSQDGDKAAVDPRKYKTRMCRNWQLKGSCPYEHTCCFAHGERDMHDLTGNHKTLASIGYFSNVFLLAMTNGVKPALPPHCLYKQPQMFKAPESCEQLHACSEVLPTGSSFPFQQPLSAAYKGIRKEQQHKKKSTKQQRTANPQPAPNGYSESSHNPAVEEQQQ